MRHEIVGEFGNGESAAETGACSTVIVCISCALGGGTEGLVISVVNKEMGGVRDRSSGGGPGMIIQLSDSAMSKGL